MPEAEVTAAIVGCVFTETELAGRIDQRGDLFLLLFLKFFASVPLLNLSFAVTVKGFVFAATGFGQLFE